MSSLRRDAEISLDGAWQFQLLPHAGGEITNSWEEVQVPSLWTMSPKADRPHYTNVVMPFDEVLPDIPEKNPQGVYRKLVTLDDPGNNQLILHVGAAEGYLQVRVNGTDVGTSTDSHLAAEFDITDAVMIGENEIELAIAKWSPESYVEDQDQWWQSGISRPVFLYSVPKVRLSDAIVVADYDPEKELGSLQMNVHTTGLADLVDPGHTIKVHILGQELAEPVGGKIAAPGLPRGKQDRSQRPSPMLPPDMLDLVSMQAASAPLPPELRAIPNIMAGQKAGAPAGTALFKLDGLEVPAWSAENPHLEELIVELLDSEGAIVDSTKYMVGFRRVEIVGRDLLVNGKRILIQGVNRHDFDPQTGRVISRERMREELSLLKKFNFNAIRTSHYPNDPYFLDLCDEYGFYVVDEADVEGHGSASVIADDPRYLEVIVERVKRMVLRDRDHASVIIWSLGNETGYGAAHDAAAAWVRRTDSTRPIHYEGAIALDWHSGHAVTDILCPMYPAFASLEAHARDAKADRPLIACEYAYSQGNATGGLADYWRLFETLPGLQGGFIWEFLDHALDPDGNGEYKFGGDFGDTPNDGAVLLNGIAFADLTPKPAMYEARGIFSPIRIVSDAFYAMSGRLRLKSRRFFADTSDLVITACVETASGRGESVKLDVVIPAGREVAVELPEAILAALLVPEALALTISISTQKDSPWAPAGTEIANHQVRLPRPPRPLPLGNPAQVNKDGNISSPFFVQPPTLSLWRALTETDNSFALDKRFVRSGFFKLTPKSVAVDEEASSTKVTTIFLTAWDEEIIHTRLITSSAPGEFVFDEHVTLPKDTSDGLVIGIEFQLIDGFTDATWVGLGPWENYPDRRESALLGRWESSIDDLATPYIVPQTNGTRGGIEQATLRGTAGTVQINTELPMHLTVSRYSMNELEEATHWWKLPESSSTFVQLSIAERGVGTALLGPDTRPEYRLSGTKYAWKWAIALTNK